MTRLIPRFLLVLVLAVAACSAPPEAMETAIPATVPAAATEPASPPPTVPPTQPPQTPTPEAEPAPTEPAATQPAADVATAEAGQTPSFARTNLYDVDAVIEAVLTENNEQLAELIRFINTPCTTADGLGGPPKCEAGQADGTEVEVFPTLGSEGSYVPPEGLTGMLELLDVGELFGVYVISPDTPSEPYWPAGQYAIVFTGNGVGATAYTFLLDDGRIVRINYHLGQTAAEAYDSGRGEGMIILAPSE